MYGYEFVKAVRVVTAEAIALGEGVIYPVLHGLEKAGCLRVRRRPINGRIRVYYAVTPKGQQRLRRLTEEWSRISAGSSRRCAGRGSHEHRRGRRQLHRAVPRTALACVAAGVSWGGGVS